MASFAGPMRSESTDIPLQQLIDHVHADNPEYVENAFYEPAALELWLPSDESSRALLVGGERNDITRTEWF